jgi:hypothetical protein
MRDNLKKREFSLPFDWLDLPVSSMMNFLSVKTSDIDTFVEDYFKEMGTGHIHSDGTWFPHDIEFIDNRFWRLKPDSSAKFARRLKRLNEILDSPGFFVFLTVAIEPDKKKMEGFDLLKIQLRDRTKGNCVFVTVNMDGNLVDGDDHFNFNIVANPKEDDELKMWERQIAEKVNLVLHQLKIDQ